MKEYTVKVDNIGTKRWYLNDERHREDGPAVELASGAKGWWLHGKRHREDGPAVEYVDGTKQWWLHGEQVTEEEHKRRTSKVTIDDALEETDRLRAKKKQIYEDLQDAVERELVQTRMMLAAPDLLATLKATVSLLENLGYVADTSLTVGAARAAIAKAKGEE